MAIKKSITITQRGKSYHFQKLERVSGSGLFWYIAKRSGAKHIKTFDSLRDMQRAYPSFDLRELR